MMVSQQGGDAVDQSWPPIQNNPNLHDIPFDSFHSLFTKTVPHVKSGLSVAASHDGSVGAVEVSNVLFHSFDVFFATKGNATRHGTTEHFVSAHSDGVNGLFEGDFWCKIDEWHHEGKESSITMNMESFTGYIQRFQCP